MESIKHALKNSKDIDAIIKIAESIDVEKDVKISWYGSRRYKSHAFKGTVCLSDFWAAIAAKSETENLNNAISIIKKLDVEANNRIKTKWLAKKLHFIPHLLGKILYFRTNHFKARIEIRIPLDPQPLNPNKSSITSIEKPPNNAILLPEQITPSKDPHSDSSPLNTSDEIDANSLPEVITPPKDPDIPIKPAELDFERQYIGEELDFNFLADEEQLVGVLMDKKLLFHIQANKFGDNSPLQGSTIESPLRYILSYLSDQNKFRPNPRFNSLIAQLTNAMNLTRSTSFEGDLQLKIQECFDKQQPLLIPGGWVGSPSGHAMYYQVIPTSDKTAIFRLYNLGAGSEAHDIEYDSTKLRCSPYLDIPHVSIEELLKPPFAKAIKEMRTHRHFPNDPIKKTNYTARDIYEVFKELLHSSNSAPEQNSLLKPRSMSPQETGVCAFRSLLAFLATEMTRKEYKKFKCDIKIQSLVKRHQELLKHGTFDVEDIRLMEKSITRVSHVIERLAKENILDKAYVKESVSALKPIHTWLQNQAETKQAKFPPIQMGWQGGLMPIGKTDIPRLHAQVTSLQSDKIIAESSKYTIAEEIKSLSASVKQGDLEALSKVEALCKKAWDSHEYLGLQIGLAEFILDLPTDPHFWEQYVTGQNAKKMITAMGVIGELYFKTCFYTAQSNAVSDEKHLVIAKATLLQQYCYEAFIKGRLSPPNIAFSQLNALHYEFFPHANVIQEWSQVDPSMSSELYAKTNDGFGHQLVPTQSFSKNAIDTCFSKLFSASIDPECAELFKKRVGVDITLMDYVNFYASEELPNWMKSIRNLAFANEYLHRHNMDCAIGTSENLNFEFETKMSDSDKVKLMGRLGGVESISSQTGEDRAVQNRYRFMRRPFNSSKLKIFYRKMYQDHYNYRPLGKLGEKDALIIPQKKIGCELQCEEFEELTRLFYLDSLRTTEVIEYFSKHPEKFKDPDYQTLFQMTFFHLKLSADLKEKPLLAKKASKLLAQNYHQLKQANEIQGSAFLLQVMRYLEKFPNINLEVDRPSELRKLLSREGLREEEKSVLYAEWAAHCSEQKMLLDQDIQDLLTALAFLERFPVPKEWEDPYIEQAIKKAPHIHAQAIRKYVSSESFRINSLDAIIQALHPNEHKRTWTYGENDGVPLFHSKGSIYQPLDGTVFLHDLADKTRSLPQAILEHPDFCKLFPGIEKGEQSAPSIYSFIDGGLRDNLVSYSHSKQKLIVEKNIGGTWHSYVPEKDLINSSKDIPSSLLGSNTLIQHYEAWSNPKNNQILLVNPKSGEVSYVCKTVNNSLEIERLNDDCVLGISSPLMNRFEDTSHIHEWYKNCKPHEIELPRFGLTFAVDANDASRLRSKEFEGFYFKPSENLPHLGSYSHYLILENEKGKKKAILPYQKFEPLPNIAQNPLQPIFIRKQDVEIGNKNPQQYLVYDITSEGLLQSTSKEANLYAAQVFMLAQEYSQAAHILKRHGPKIDAYTTAEWGILEAISSLNEISGDQDVNAAALRTYASYLLLKDPNMAQKRGKEEDKLHLDGKNNYKKYLSGLNNATALPLSREQEIYLLKTFLNSTFDPIFFLRLRELDPKAAAVASNPKKSQFENGGFFANPSLKLPNHLPELPKNLVIKRPELSKALVTRMALALGNEFYDYYEMARTATPSEREWLLSAQLFNRFSGEPELGNFLEVVAKYPHSFKPVPSGSSVNNIKEWMEEQANVAKDRLATHREAFELKTPPMKITDPILRERKVEPSFHPMAQSSASFTLSSSERSFSGLTKHLFIAQSQTRNLSLIGEIKRRLQGWKIGNNTMDSELDRLHNDFDALENIPLPPIYTLKTQKKVPWLPIYREASNLDDIEKILTPPNDNDPQVGLKQQELALLMLANRSPEEENDLLRHELQLMAEIKKPITLEDLIINFGRQEPGFLQERNPFLTADEISSLYGKIGDFLITATHEQQRKRALATVQKIKDLQKQHQLDPNEETELVQQLAADLLAERCYDPKESPIYLSFEYFLDVIIRETQKTKISQFGKFPNAMMQMIMGAGKTSILLQLLGYFRADEKKLSLLVVPQSLFESVASQTQQIHLNTFGKQLRTLHFDRNTSFTKHSLEVILDDLRSTIKNRECMIMTSKSISCLVLKYVEQCVTLPPSGHRSEELMLMDEIIKVLGESGYPLMDEIDTLLNVLHEVSFSLGNLIPIDEGEGNTIKELYHILYTDPSIKALAYVDSDPSPDRKAPPLTGDLYHSTVKDKLAAAFINRLATMQFESKAMETKMHRFANSLTKEQQTLLQYYLCHEQKHINAAQQFFNGIDPELQDILALAAEEISSFLPYTLTMNSDEKYGIDKEGGMLSIPYAAANTPSKGSDFKNSHITMNTTFQTYLKKGIPSKCIVQLIEELHRKAILELKENPDLDIEETEAWKSFSKLKGDVDMPLSKYNRQQLKALNAHINKDIATKSRFIIEFILPALKRYDSALTFNSQNLASFFECASGFSGTTWNASTIHHRFQTLLEAGIDAKTIEILWRNSKTSILTIKSDSVNNMYEEMTGKLKGDFDILIDAGGYFKEGSNAEIAEILAVKSGKKAIYYDKKGVQKLTDGVKRSPLKHANIREGDRKTFLDQSRTTGADVKQKPTAVGIVTIGRNLLLRDLLQSAWRLRGLDKGQKVTFLVSDEVSSIIRKVCNKESDSELSFEDILQFAIFNQASQLSKDNFKAFKTQLRNIPQMMLLKAVMSGSLTEDEAKKAQDHLRALWIKPANQPARKLYGQIATERNTSDIIKQEKSEIIASISECFNTLPSLSKMGFTLKKSLEEVDKIESRFLKLLPPMLKTKETDDDQTVELETEEQSQQEQETELEVHEHQETFDKHLFDVSFGTLSRITNIKDDFSKHNYVSLDMYLQSDPQLRDFAYAFEGIDLTVNVLQMSSASPDLKSSKLFGQARIPLHHFFIAKDGSIILANRNDASTRSLAFSALDLSLYNLTLGAIDPIVMTPEIFEKIVKVKFLNGISSYSKEERVVLKKWISQQGVEKMRELYSKHILSGLPMKVAEYNAGSDLKKIFLECR